MKEIWDLAISPAMLPLTILLAPVGIYWLFSILGAAGHGSHGHHGGGGGRHIGGHNHGPGHHGHTAHHGHGQNHHHHGHSQNQGGHHLLADLLHGVIRVMNSEDVPLMIPLSILILLLWGGAMLGNVWFGHAGGLTATAIPIVALFIGLALTRVAVIPLKPIFRLIQTDAELEIPMVGRSGYVRTASVDPAGGQVVVENRGAPIIVGARTASDSEPILRNTRVLVIGRDDDTGIYIVRPMNEILPSV